MDMMSKGPSVSQNSPMGSGIVAGNTAAFPAAPQLNPIQQASNVFAAPQPEMQQRQKMFQQMQNSAPQPAQMQPVQFANQSGSGNPLSDFLAAMLKKQGGPSNGI